MSVRAVLEKDAKAPAKKAVEAVSPIQKEVETKLRYQLGKSKQYDTGDIYQGTAWSVREHLIDSFEDTHDYWE
jgi:starch phosphorylase